MIRIAAQLKNARMTPRKVRQLRSVVVGKPVREVQTQLQWQNGKAAQLVAKVLASAIANAKNNLDISEEELTVVALNVDEGIKFKRYNPVSRGMAHSFQERNCHIRVVVGSDTKELDKKKVKANIETLTVEELAKSEQAVERLEESKKEVASGDAEGASLDAAMLSRSKNKMMQQGGDKDKGHRRKSI